MYNVKGYITSKSTGEPLIGATIFFKQLEKGTATNTEGFFSIRVPEGKYDARISFMGYEKVNKTIEVNKDKTINLKLEEKSIEKQEVQIHAPKEKNDVNKVQMSVEEVEMKQLKTLPSFFGEPDIIKNIQTKPGVISAGEGTSAFFVRGGSADQNLILLDDSPIYDPSHFFGLFSVFNADIVKSATLYKGGIPAQFGGRLSSILDVKSRKGNMKAYSGKATIGLLSAKAVLEGPIKKNKSSFLLAGRRSYAGQYLKLSPNEEQRDNNLFFYDINARADYRINENNKIHLSAYWGRDAFKIGEEFAFDWGNKTATLKWDHAFNDEMYLSTSIIASNFDYKLELMNQLFGFQWISNIQQYSLKQDYSYNINKAFTINFGFNSSYRSFFPGNFKPIGSQSIFDELMLDKLHAWENAVYLGTEHDVTARLSMQYGLRFSTFSQIGPITIYDYADPNDVANVTKNDSTQYGKGELVEMFYNPEPRLSARYKLGISNSVKLSYNRMSQYIHQMNTGTIPLPFNFWQPSSPYITPSIADQIAIGYFHNFSDNKYQASVETYYKEMQDVVGFRDNANIFFNDNLPLEIRTGRAWSYGAEFQLKKSKGPVKGALSYTWSKTMRKLNNVNQGEPFPASHDRRHSASLTGTYDFSERLSFGLQFVFSSGRPITVPSGKYIKDHYVVNQYSTRNGYRLPPFHRLDLSATLKSKEKPGRKWSSKWNFSIYNVYNRKNTFTLYTRPKLDENNKPIGLQQEAVKIYLFSILPSVSYSIEF